jgi:hypothetical protein
LDDILQEDDTWSYVTTETIAVTVANNATIEIFRSTPYEPLVTFTNASLLNQDDQNTAALQAIYLIEELLDGQTELISDIEIISTQQSTALTFVIDGGGGEITPGEEVSLLLPFAGTILRAYILVQPSGSLVVDLRKLPVGDFPPSVANSITGATPLTLSSGVTVVDSSLSDWDTSIAINDVLTANIISVTDVERATVVVVVERA